MKGRPMTDSDTTVVSAVSGTRSGSVTVRATELGLPIGIAIDERELRYGGGALASTQKRIQKDASSRMASLLPNMSTTSSLGLPLFDGEGGLVPELQGEG